MFRYHKLEVGQIYRCNYSDALFLVVEVNDESHISCKTESLYCEPTEYIGFVYSKESFPVDYYTLIC
jgi:hypothetical protein